MTVLMRALLPFLLLAASGFANAHNVLKSSSPENGVTLSTAPSEVTLEFNGAVRLVKFTIERDGTSLELDFAPQLTAAKSFSVPTPELGSGAFEVSFSIIGEDGHAVAGHLGFGVGAHAPSAAAGH